jgi:hypothetical protein
MFSDLQRLLVPVMLKCLCPPTGPLGLRRFYPATIPSPAPNYFLIMPKDPTPSQQKSRKSPGPRPAPSGLGFAKAVTTRTEPEPLVTTSPPAQKRSLPIAKKVS